MNARLSPSNPTWWQHRTKRLFLLGLILILARPAWAGPSSSSGSDSSVSGWISGLSKTSLGDFADLDIPLGYKFLGSDGARMLLQSRGNRVPEGLLGVLAPDNGAWWAVLQFNNTGYRNGFTDEETDQLRLIQKVRENMAGGPGNRSTDVMAADWVAGEWPAYDSANHVFSWAIQMPINGRATLNSSVLLLGRKGTLEITAVLPANREGSVPPLKQLARNLTFRDGNKFEDYKNGDKLATLSVSDMVIGTGGGALTSAQPAGRISKALIYYPILGCLLIGGVIAYVKYRRWKKHNAMLESRGIRRALITNVAIQNGAAHHAMNGTNGANGHATNGHSKNGNGSNGSHRGNGRARKRMMFDYSKFYVDFVVRTGANAAGSPILSEKTVNGYDSESAPHSSPSPLSNGASLSKDLELISSLRTLIEEQKSLIYQQTKFIDEKNKFIEEQSDFLERQSAMAKDQYNLKLD